MPRAEARELITLSDPWQRGCGRNRSRSGLFAFTLDKSVGTFSPTTRHGHYPIRQLLCESRSAPSVDSGTGRRYINSATADTSVVLLLASDGRPGLLVPEQPIGWERDHQAPRADLYTSLAAGVASERAG